MLFIHEKEANSILTKSGLKHLVAVTPSIVFSICANLQKNLLGLSYLFFLTCVLVCSIT